jgi:hypothetical protein
MTTSHPPSARARLEIHGQRRAELAKEQADMAADLPKLIREGKEAGLSMTEIARLASVSRWTIYQAQGT